MRTVIEKTIVDVYNDKMVCTGCQKKKLKFWKPANNEAKNCWELTHPSDILKDIFIGFFGHICTLLVLTHFILILLLQSRFTILFFRAFLKDF